MDYVRLGSTGLKVSRICLGCMTYGSSKWRPWVLDEEASRPLLRRAVDVGINFFDTADMYSDGGSEEVLGRALNDFAKRHEVVLATKVFFPMGPGPNDRGLSRKHIFDAIDASLKRLGTDYVDLYQTHRYDPETPLEETLEALHDVVGSGKARYIGASSMYAWQFAQALSLADRRGWTRFVSMQNHYNLIYREEEREMLPLCRAEGIGVIPWSPLARGLLTGSRRRGKSDETPREVRRVCEPALRGLRLRCRRPRRRGGEAPRDTAGADRTRLAAAPAGCHSADRWRLQGGASGGCHFCGLRHPFRRREPFARRALPPASRARAFIAVRRKMERAFPTSCSPEIRD